MVLQIWYCRSDQLGMPEAAVRCYRRAMPHDREGVAVQQLAVLHAQLGQKATAAHYHRLNLARIDAEGLTGQDAVDALSFLAEHAQQQGDLTAAEGYFMRLLDYGADHKERAKASLRELRAMTAGPVAAGASGGTPGGAFAFARQEGLQGGGEQTPGSDMGVSPGG
jgi:tetratricopeptide (TPR) repeat protein